MALWEFLSGALQPIADIFDNVSTTDEERLLAKNKLTELENTLASKMLEYESQLLTAQSNIIIAEAQGQSWLQRNWRPITMLTFLALVVFDSFGLLTFRLADQAWTLLQLGLGGYVIGRSAEKVVKELKKKGG